MSKPDVAIRLFAPRNLLKAIAEGFVFSAIQAGIIWVGVLTDSSAMQWSGFLFFLLAVAGLAKSLAAEKEMSPQEATDYLLKQFNVRAGEAAE